MRRHHAIVHDLVAEHGGWRPVDQGEGDSVFAVFAAVPDCLRAALDIQLALQAEPWPEPVTLGVRMGLHAGHAVFRDGNLYGDTVNRCARIRSAGHAGQTLMSTAFYELARDQMPERVTVIDLGEHLLKDLARPERIRQITLAGLIEEFPPLVTLTRARHNLAVQPTAFIGREAALAEVVDLVGQHRLVTITGFGGMGKTRLALQVAAELADGAGDGVWFVDLTQVSDATQVPSAIAAALSLPEIPEGPRETVLRGLAPKNLLLVLDNVEHVMGCTPLVAELLRRCPDVFVLATSREPLRIQAECEFSLQPLTLPDEWATGGDNLQRLGTSDAVRLFVDRARAVDRTFAVTNDNAPAIAGIVARLDGHPLALELAAARLRILSPDTLLQRLSDALSLLTGGSRDMPDRHRTLHATITWSYDLLPIEEQVLLQRMSVFAGPVTLEAVDAVCSAPLPGVDHPLDAMDGISALVEKSLVRTTTRSSGERVFDLLVSVRDFAHRQLVASGTEDGLVQSHGRWALAEGRMIDEPNGTFLPTEFGAAVTRATAIHLEMRAALERLDLVSAESLGGAATSLLSVYAIYGRMSDVEYVARLVIDVLDHRGRDEPGDFFVRRYLAVARAFRDDATEAREVFNAMLERARRLPWRGQHAMSAANLLRYTHDFTAHAALMAELEELCDQLDDRHEMDLTLVRHEMALDLMDIDPERALSEAKKIPTSAVPNYAMSKKSELGSALLFTGSLDEAQSTLEAVNDEALGPGPRLRLFTGQIHLRLLLGDLAGAEHLLDRAERLAADHDVGQKIKASRADIHHFRGEYQLAFDACSGAAETRSGKDRAGLFWRRARALAALDQPEKALAALELAAAETRALGVHGVSLGVAVERLSASLGRPIEAVDPSAAALRQNITVSLLPIGTPPPSN